MTQLRLVIALLTVLALAGLYIKGRADGKSNCTSAVATTALKQVENNDKVDKQVRGMDVPALDRALSRWLRPDSN